MRHSARHITMLTAVLLLAGCSAQPRVPTTVDLNYEGLQTFPSQRFEIAQMRPGVDFTKYSAVYPRGLELEFRRPDGSQQEFPLKEEQKEGFRELLIQSFTDEFTANSTIQFVDEPGPSALGIRVRVIDIVALVPPRTVGGQIGRGGIALDASGRVTLVVEVSDSESGQVLARGIETRQVRGAAMQSEGAMLTRWEDVDELTDRWAQASRTGLEELMEYDGS